MKTINAMLNVYLNKHYVYSLCFDERCPGSPVMSEQWNVECTGVMHSTVCHRLAQLRPAPHLAFTSNKAFICYEKLNDNLGLNMMFSPFTITVLLRNKIQKS